MAGNIFDSVVDQLGAPQPTVTPNPTQPENPAGDTSAPIMGTTVPQVPDEEEEKKVRQQAISANVHQVIGTSADQNAADIKLATSQGVPVDTAARQRALLSRRQKVSEIDFGALLNESPELGKQLEDKYFASASHDDLENLGTLEQWANAATSGFTAGRESNELNRLQFTKSFSPVDTPNIDATIRAMKAKAANQQEADGFGGWIQSAAQIAGQLESNFEAGAAGAAGGAVAGAGIGALGGSAVGGVGAIPGAGAGAVAGAIAGFGRGFFTDLVVTSMGSSFSSLDDLEAEQGQKLNTGAKYSVAMGVGLVNAYFERLSLGLLGKPLEEAAKKVITKKVGEKIAQQGFRQAATKFGRAYGAAVLGETAQEGAQSALQSLGNEVAAQLSWSDYQGLLQDPKKFDAAVDNALSSMEVAFKGTALLGVPGPGFNFAHDTYTARKSAHNQEALRAIADTSANSKLAERLPEQFQQFVQRVRERAGPAGVENVYIPAKEFATYFQSQGESDVAIANQLGLGEQYEGALASGGDLVVPLETVAAKLARSDHYAGLEQFIRVAPDDMSLAELKAFNPDEARTQQDINDAQTTLRKADEQTASDRVFSQVYGQLLNTSGNPEVARSQAGLIGGIYDALASRSSLQDPQSLMDRFGLRVENVLPESVRRTVDVVRRARPVDRAQQVELMADTSPEARPFVSDAAAVKEYIGGTTNKLDPNNPRAVTRATGMAATPLLTRIQQMGGIKTDDYTGELATALDGRKGAKLRISRKDGMGLDDMARALQAEGYIGKAGQMASPEDLINAINADAGGQRVYPVEVRDALAGMQEDPNSEADMARYIEELGITAESTIPQIAEAMAKHAAETRQQLEESRRNSEAEGAGVSLEDEGANIFFQMANAVKRVFSDPEKAEAKAFKKWFGESKVVDANGEPMVMYHGTGNSENMDSFKPELTGKGNDQLGSGFYFTTNPNEASGYTTSITQNAKPGASKLGGDSSPGVVPVYLSIQKPIQIKGANLNDSNAKVTAKQAAAIIKRAANLNDPDESPLGNWIDMYSAGKVTDAMILEVAQNYEGPNLMSLENDFFRDDAENFRKAVRDTLGYDGVVQTFDDGTKHFVAWFPEQIKSVFNKGDFNSQDPNILNQDAKGGKTNLPGTAEPRGSIQFTDNPELQGAMQAVIKLGPKADLSTFLHETGHLGLEMMRYLVKTGDADEGLQNDLNTLLEWFGVDSADKIGRDQHEQFAKGFEIYLREGKAPSLRLHDAFNRFRAWLTRIYASVRGLNVELSPQVREVMDRLVATDAEIEEARSLDRFAADPEIMKLMTDAERTEYQRHIQRAVDYAGEQVMKQSLGEAFERNGKPYLEEQERVRGEVEAEVNAQPVYKAIEWLGGAKWIDGEKPEGFPEVKLNRAALVDEFGEGILKSLPRTFGYLYTKDGGITADEAATLFGFGSGQEMVQQMVKATPRKAVIEERTKSIMNTRHGDVMNDGSIEREALDSLHNEHRARAIAAELRALSKSAKKEPSVNAYSRQIAKDFVARNKYMNISSFNRFYRAEVAAAKEAQAAVLDGDTDAALKAKQRQLLNHYLFMEARSATQEVEKNVRHFKKLLNAREGRKIDPDYLDQIETLLGRFNFTRLSAKAIERRKSLADFITQKQAEDVVLTIPEKLRNEAFKQNYRDMTVSDIRSLFDAVTNIEHNGRLKRTLIVAGQKREYAEVKDSILQSIAGNGMKVTRASTQNPTDVDKLISGAKSADASLLRVEDLARTLDGGKDLGAIHQAIYGVLADANANRFRLMVDVSDKVAKLINNASREQKKRWNQWHEVKSIGRTFKGTDIMAMALNMGNKGNYDRLLRGESWTDQQVRDATSVLTKEDWDTVQGIWDVLESLQPQLAEVMKDQTGLKFEKVNPTPVQTPHGIYRGGYYPIVYDKTHSYEAWVADQQSVVREDGTGALFEKSPILPEVERGFTQSRGERGLDAPLFLSLDVLPSHMDKVIHYITMAGPVKQVDRLLRDKDITNAIIGSVGMEKFRILRPWLAAVARGNANDEKVDIWQRAARHIRVGTTLTALGFKAVSGLRQFEGLAPVAGHVGSGNALYGIAQVLNPGQWRYAFEASKILQHRSENFDRDIGTVMRSINRASTTKQMVGKLAMSFISYSQLVVDTAAWHAGHQKWLKEHPMDEDGAIRFADSTVRMTQGSGEVMDLIAFQRGNEFQKLYATFYTPFSVIYNAVRRASSTGMTAKSALGVTHAIFWTVTLPVMMDIMIDAAMKGQGDDDDDSFLKEMLVRHLTTIGGGIPVLRDAITVATEGRAGGSAIADFTTKTGKIVGDLFTADADERTLKNAVQTFSVLTHIPVSNPYKTIEHVVNSASGASDFNIGDFLQGERGR